MKVLRAYDFNRNDCTMDEQCEYCQHVVVDKYAYNDQYYREQVVPSRHCPNCGKNSKGLLQQEKTPDNL